MVKKNTETSMIHKLFFENSNEGYVLIEKNKIIDCNKAVVNMFGYNSKKNLIGQMPFDLPLDKQNLSKNNLQKTEEIVNDLLFKEKYSFDWVIKRNDGKELPVEVYISKLVIEDRIITCFSIRDITRRKWIEKILRESEEKYIKLFNEAMEYDKLKTQFFSNLSHELRTPLNVILGTIQLLMMYVNENSSTHIEKNICNRIKVLKQNCYRLLRLVNNLIDITKIDAGYYELELQNENIVRIVEEIALSVAEYIGQKNINLIFDTNIEEKIVACDPDKIERIVLNLLSNAIKFTDPGGKISVNVYDKGELIRISVKDTGIGIPKDEIENIFEHFRQVDKSFTRRHEGSGIGLSLVKSLVEMHGGSIAVESEYGRGSEFIIEFPVRVLETGKNIIIKETNINNLKNNHVEIIDIEFSDIYS